MKSGSEEQLALRAGRGDRRALEQLWTEHEARLCAIVRGRLGPNLRRHLESADILQSAFLDAVRDYSAAAQPKDEFLPWIARVIERAIQDRARYFGRQRRAATREVAMESVDERALRARTPTPSSGPQTDEERARLLSALDRLRPVDRRLVQLSRIEKKPAKEIARLLGKTEEATQRAINRAVARLSVLMGTS